MEENREPLSAIAIEKKLQLLRNKHFSEDTIALVKSDYEYGLKEEEISLYLNKSYDIEQMKILSECLHKDVPKDVIDIIKNTKYSVHQMQVSLEFYEKGVPVQTIKEVMDKGEKPITMRRLYEEVLEQLNKVKKQIPEESEYVKALISQMDEVVAKINHQNERYDALNKKLSEIETSKDDEEVRERLVKENQDKDALINSQQNELNKASSTIARLRDDIEKKDKESEREQPLCPMFCTFTRRLQGLDTKYRTGWLCHIFVKNLCTARNTWIIWTKSVLRVHFITLNQSPRLVREL